MDYPAGTADLSFGYDALNRLTNLVDAVGTTKFTYDAAGNLKTEDGPWASDTVTYMYHSSAPRLRTGLSLAQPSGAWTKGDGPVVGRASRLPADLVRFNRSDIPNVHGGRPRLRSAAVCLPLV